MKRLLLVIRQQCVSFLAGRNNPAPALRRQCIGRAAGALGAIILFGVFFTATVYKMGTKPFTATHTPPDDRSQNRESVNPATFGETDDEESGERFDYFKGWYGQTKTWSAERQLKAMDEIRAMSNGDRISVKGAKGRMTASSAAPWIQEGPMGMFDLDELGAASVWSGRVNALAFTPSGSVLIGAAEGGLWKLSGTVATPLSDYLPSIGVSAVAVSPADSNTIYLGTGDYNGGIPGTGLYRSLNGGAGWVRMNLSSSGPDFITKIIIVPSDPNTIVVATNVGVSRSTDNGGSWAWSSSFISADISDMATSADGQYMLAGYRGRYVVRSTDLGVTWQNITQLSKQFKTTADRISVAIHGSRAYAQVGDAKRDSVVGVYKSTDKGVTWSNITPNSPAVLTDGKKNYLAQEDYNNAIAVNPGNPDIVWAGGMFLVRSGDGGASWSNRGATGARPRLCHSDIHALAYMNSSTLYVGSDGGIAITTDAGITWNTLPNRYLPITQFYNTDRSRVEGAWTIGGAQDNGVSSSAGPSLWTFRIRGDGNDGKVMPGPLPLAIYCTHNGQGNSWRRRSTDGGSTWQGINSGIDPGDNGQGFGKTFLATDESHPDWLYTNGGNYAYVSTDRGTNWSRMNTAPVSGNTGHASVSNLGSYVYYVVSDPDHPLVRFQLTLPGFPYIQTDISSGLPAGVQVKRVHASSSLTNVAYALMMGIGDSKKIYKTTDMGDSWTNITGNLPDVPVNDLVDDYANPKKLYLATDKGAFRSNDGGKTWLRWNEGLPEAIRIMDMKFIISAGGNFIHCGTYGRSTWQRRVDSYDPVFNASSFKLSFGSIVTAAPAWDSVLITNSGGANLDVALKGSNRYLVAVPDSASVAPGDSVWFHIVALPGSSGGGPVNTMLKFVYNGEGSPVDFPVTGFFGDSTRFRSFPPESLTTKKPVRKKNVCDSWVFTFPRSDSLGFDRAGATSLTIQFAQPVDSLTVYPQFRSAESLDRKRTIWKLSGGAVQRGQAAVVGGMSPKPQLVKQWWWNAQVTVWTDDIERTLTTIPGGIQGVKSPTSESFLMPMPNIANVINEVFARVPLSRAHPLTIGVADPSAKQKGVAFVALAKPGDLLASLMPGRSGAHTGTPRFFNTFDNGGEMAGELSKLTASKQNNRLFAGLVALKLNLYASIAEITPAGFGQLRYVKAGSRFNDWSIQQIADSADRYMTYGDSSAIGSGSSLDSVVQDLNTAFVGEMDTLSFASRLVLTGPVTLAEVPYLRQAPAGSRDQNDPSVIADAHPLDFALDQNYPNPFNPATTISFALPAPSVVTMKVFDIAGREVAALVDHSSMEEGYHSLSFDGGRYSSGIYFYRIQAKSLSDPGKSFVQVKKMMLLK